MPPVRRDIWLADSVSAVRIASLMAAMIKQAQKMQQEMLRMQEEMENKTYKATAGGGMVTAEVSGKHQVVSLRINPEAVDPDDVEMLQ